jgi:hypothetical protein
MVIAMCVPTGAFVMTTFMSLLYGYGMFMARVSDVMTNPDFLYGLCCAITVAVALISSHLYRQNVDNERILVVVRYRKDIEENEENSEESEEEENSEESEEGEENSEESEEGEENSEKSEEGEESENEENSEESEEEENSEESEEGDENSEHSGESDNSEESDEEIQFPEHLTTREEKERWLCNDNIDLYVSMCDKKRKQYREYAESEEVQTRLAQIIGGKWIAIVDNTFLGPFDSREEAATAVKETGKDVPFRPYIWQVGAKVQTELIDEVADNSWKETANFEALRSAPPLPDSDSDYDSETE